MSIWQEVDEQQMDVVIGRSERNVIRCREVHPQPCFQMGCLRLHAILMLRHENKRMRDALESIASLQSIKSERHIDKEFWLNQSHGECAELIAYDTETARKALSPAKVGQP